MAKAKVNGIEIYYEIHGKGEPLVLVLGFSMNHFAWGPLIEAFAEKFQVILFDNRGAGESEAPDEPYSIDQMAKDTLGLLDELGIEEALFLGHSMGSLVCQVIAYIAKERVKKMVLSGTFSKRRQTTAFAFDLYGKLYSEGLPYDRLIELFMPFVFSDTFLSNPENIDRLRKLLKEDPCPITLAGYRGQGEALNQFDSEDFLKKIKVPTLVIGYEKDICTFLDSAILVASKIPNAEFSLMEGVGHTGFAEQPKVFLQKTIPFLSS